MAHTNLLYSVHQMLLNAIFCAANGHHIIHIRTILESKAYSVVQIAKFSAVRVQRVIQTGTFCAYDAYQCMQIVTCCALAAHLILQYSVHKVLCFVHLHFSKSIRTGTHRFKLMQIYAQSVDGILRHHSEFHI